jgi:hypothetical protein
MNVEPKNKTDFKCDELQEIVEGYFEVLRLSKSQIMIVNEEGKILQKPYNHLATLTAYMAGIKDIIVGNVLVCDIDKVK